MKIPRCRYWRCPECRALYEKKDLADFLRRERQGEEVTVTGKYRCTRCGTLSRAADVYAGDYDVPKEEWDQLPGPAEATVDRAAKPRPKPDQITADPEPPPRRRKRGQPAEPEETEWAILDEEETEDEEEVQDERRRHTLRRRALAEVNIGLAIHYGGMVAFLLGLVVGWLGMVIGLSTAFVMGARSPDDPVPVAQLAASDFLFLTSWVLTAFSVVADLVSAAFCLWVRDTMARGYLVACVVVRVFAAPSGLVLMFFDQPGLAMLATTFLVIVGWVLWVVFLWGLAHDLNHPDLGREAVKVTFSAFMLVVWWVVTTTLLIGFLIMALLLLRIGGMCMCMSPLSLAGLIAGIIRYLLASGKFDSILTLVLYPTGVPLILRYLDLIGTMRMIILRRS